MCGPHKAECDACVTRVHGSDLVPIRLCHLWDKFWIISWLQEKHTAVAGDTTADELLAVKQFLGEVNVAKTGFFFFNTPYKK